MKRAPFRILICVSALTAALEAGPVGIFENSGDIGITPKAGKSEFDAASGEYRITGGGANVWAKVDAFQFVWKRVSGDVTLTADVRFEGAGKAMHRKAMLMIRQGLEPEAPYGDAALHGDGLTSLQYRLESGGITAEVRSALNKPTRIRIERRGDRMTLYAGNPGEGLKPSGPTVIVLKDPVYVGLAVCSHIVDNLETAIFSNVKLESAAANRASSKISIYDLKTNAVEAIYSTNQHFEAPNWAPDGKYLLLNSGGGLWRLSLESKPAAAPVKIDLGTLTGCNNDHGISKDGKWLAISASPPKQKSQVYVAAADGSQVRQMVSKSPSYFHGWSPDGRWLAFVGQRDGNFDLFRVAFGAAGGKNGEEQRLTSNTGYDDGPDYSPDGKWIYFNSDRSGSWDIWRIPAAGGGKDDKRAQQVTKDELEDWFPHPSPDGKQMVFISFEKGTKGHPGGQDVVLRMMPMPGAKLKPAEIKTLIKVHGGQGTMNVNSWAPDSQRFAFVAYE